MRISDWSSDVCSSDLLAVGAVLGRAHCLGDAGVLRFGQSVDAHLPAPRGAAAPKRTAPAGKAATAAARKAAPTRTAARTAVAQAAEHGPPKPDRAKTAAMAPPAGVAEDCGEADEDQAAHPAHRDEDTDAPVAVALLAH